jgi:hypothetical protein
LLLYRKIVIFIQKSGFVFAVSSQVKLTAFRCPPTIVLDKSPTLRGNSRFFFIGQAANRVSRDRIVPRTQAAV